MKTIAMVVMLLLLPSMAWADLPCVGFDTEDSTSLVDALDEISGIAASRNMPGYFWAQVDSGGPAELYLLDASGKLVQSYPVAGATNVDWEDIAVAPCPEKHPENCIYIADLGDNRFTRRNKKIWIVEEPKNIGQKAPLAVHAVVEVAFGPSENDPPSRSNPDSESLLVHPQTANIYIVSKQSKGDAQTLYRIPFRRGTPVTPVALASYRYMGGLGALAPIYNAVTGADFAPDGTRFLIRTYAVVYEYDLVRWKTMADAFQHPVERVRTEEVQGEAVAYAADGKSIVTAGERVKSFIPANLNRFTCIPNRDYEPPTEVDYGRDAGSPAIPAFLLPLVRRIVVTI